MSLFSSPKQRWDVYVKRQPYVNLNEIRNLNVLAPSPALMTHGVGVQTHVGPLRVSLSCPLSLLTIFLSILFCTSS